MPAVSSAAAELDPVALFGSLADHRAIGLAVSGGPDSLALMLLAARWRDAGAAPKLFVYTVDHRLRPEAADEAAMVAQEAEKLDLPCRTLHWDAPKPPSGIQAAARRARYRLLADAARADGATVVLTAHHIGDQAETVLMRMAHGSGIDGLRGMDAEAEIEGCRIARPLLGVDPAALRRLVLAAGLTPAADPSNADETYERVRWRNEMLRLAALGLDAERLTTLARRLGAAAELVDDGVTGARKHLVIANGRAELPQAELAELNPLIGAALLVEALQAVSGDERAPGLAQVEALCRLLATGGAVKSTTLHGCVISADGSKARIAKEPPRRQANLSVAAIVTPN